MLPPPPTDPDVKNSLIRFLGSRTQTRPAHDYAAPEANVRLALRGSAVTWFVASECLPGSSPEERHARHRLPSSGSLGLRFPTFIGTMLR